MHGFAMKHTAGLSVLLLATLAATAGEIVFLPPAPSSSSYPVIPVPYPKTSRAERDVERHIDHARQRASRSSTPDSTYLLEQGGKGNAAPDYLTPSSTSAGGDDFVTLNLRAAPPPSDAKRAQQKARIYSSSDAAQRGGRDCSTASNQVGMIGEGAGAQQHMNVVEQGGGVITPRCP